MNLAVILLAVIVYINLLRSHSIVAHDDEHFDLTADSHHHNHDDHQHQHSHHGLRSTTSSSLIDWTSNSQSNASEYRRLNSDNSEHCGTRNPTSTEFKVASEVVTKWITNQLLDLKQLQTIEIDTYFHIILNGGVDEDTPTTEVLEKMIALLNDSFRPHSFSFRLLGTTYTDNIDWYFAEIFSQEQTDMKAALRVGDASTLNVYFNQPSDTDPEFVLYGYATFPFSYQSNPLDDGVVIYNQVFPGGFIPSRQGKTLPHEVGHWLGLFHTFQPDIGVIPIKRILYALRLLNDCSLSNDGVGDTPRSKSPNYGCPTGADTCPFRRGLDPIHNYMEYTDDACRKEFTPGQSERMWAMWNEYRAP